ESPSRDAGPGRSMTARVPTDKAILDILRAADATVGWPQLMRELATNPDEERALKRLPKKAVAAGRIVKLKGKRYALPPDQPVPVDASATDANAANGAAPTAGSEAPVPGRKGKGTGKGAKSTGDGPPHEGILARVVREGKFLFAVT